MKVISLIRHFTIHSYYCIINQSEYFLLKDLSKNIFVRTRKMVNYGWVGWSQRKLWWKLVALLTCKSLVKLTY